MLDQARLRWTPPQHRHRGAVSPRRLRRDGGRCWCGCPTAISRRSRPAREGLAVGAWMRELAVRAADSAGWDLAVSRREVLSQLVRVRVEVAVILGADDRSAARDCVMAACAVSTC
ncbi:MAG: hypothetical protein ACRDRK_15575 [Pseudonocardia sp.]